MCGVWYKQLLGNYSCHDQTNFVLQEMEAFFMKYANCIHWRQGCHMSSNVGIVLYLISTQWHFFFFFASRFQHAKSQQLFFFIIVHESDPEWLRGNRTLYLMYNYPPSPKFVPVQHQSLSDWDRSKHSTGPYLNIPHRKRTVPVLTQVTSSPLNALLSLPVMIFSCIFCCSMM